MSLTPEDIKLLEAPLPLADHEAREKGEKNGKKQYLFYINQEGVIPLLNGIDPDWSWDVMTVQISERYVSVTGRLTIKGVSRDGVGGNSPNSKTAPVDEDTVKGAETDALKRAALRFGVGLYLRSAPMCWIDANLKPWEAEKAALAEFATWYKREFGQQGAQNGRKPQPSTPPPPSPNAPLPATPPTPAGTTGASGSAPAGGNGDSFGKQFPPKREVLPSELWEAMHDFFDNEHHFKAHWEKHAATYDHMTLEEASAWLRNYHWNYDKEQCKRLVADAKANYGMDIDNVMEALSDAAGHSVKRMVQWDAGDFQTARAAVTVWAETHKQEASA